MKSKLDELTAEQSQLAARIAELETEQASIRAAMKADPLKAGQSLAASYSQRQIQAEVCRERLAEVIALVQAEVERLNSPEVRNGIKRAEKLIAENQATRNKVFSELTGIISEIDGALMAAREAAQLLKNGGRNDDGAGVATELSEVKQMLSGWVMARQQRAALAASAKEQTARAKAKAEAEAAARQKEAEKPKKRAGLFEGFIQQAR